MEKILERSINTFRYLDYKTYLDHGSSPENSFKSFCLSPYKDNHQETISYTYLNDNQSITDEYLMKENLFINSFQSIFNKYAFIGIEKYYDRICFLEFQNSVALNTFIRQGLREDTTLNLLVDDLAIIVDFNFDLNIILNCYSNNFKEDILSFFEILKKNNLNIREISSLD